MDNYCFKTVQIKKVFQVFHTWGINLTSIGRNSVWQELASTVECCNSRPTIGREFIQQCCVFCHLCTGSSEVLLVNGT
jgi:hypothetical protein